MIVKLGKPLGTSRQDWPLSQCWPTVPSELLMSQIASDFGPDNASAHREAVPGQLAMSNSAALQLNKIEQ